MIVPERISQSQVLSYLFGTLHLSGMAWREQPTVVDTARRHFLQLLSQGMDHLPFYLVVDLTLLIQSGSQAPLASETDWPSSARSLLRRYQQQLLLRLLREFSLQEALEIIGSNPTQAAPRQLYLLLCLLRRFAIFYPAKYSIQALHVRQLGSLSQTPETLGTLLSQSDEPANQFTEPLIELLEPFLQSLDNSFRWSQIVTEEELFELKFWEQLQTEDLRLAARQLFTLVEELGDFQPNDVILPTEEPEVAVFWEDESHYPTGGFSEISNQGSLENLMTSELIYMETASEIDFFDIRFVQNELLFYARDSGQIYRRRRAWHFFIDLPDLLSYKSPAYPYRYGLLAAGLVVRLIRDLFSWFAEDQCWVTIHFSDLSTSEWTNKELISTSRSNHADQQDRTMLISLLRLIFHDEIQHGWLQIHLFSASTSFTWQRPGFVTTWIGITGSDELLWQVFQASLNNQKQPALTIKTMHWQVATANSISNTTPFCLPSSGLTLEQLQQLKNQAVQQLLGS